MVKISRRAAVLASAAPIMAPKSLGTAEILRSTSSGFRMINWQDHFDQIGKGIIIADIASRALRYRGPERGDYPLYPSPIPIREEWPRRDHRDILRQRLSPDRSGPDITLGPHALYLSWPAYPIHGRHKIRKIGRPRLRAASVFTTTYRRTFARAEVGTRVLLL